MIDKPGSTTHTTLQIDEHDTLPDVLGRIRAADGQSVALAIPDHSPILLTATEFRTLRDEAERYGVTLTLQTDDELRLQLASMFGLAERVRSVVSGDGETTDGEMEATPSFTGWRVARAKHTARMAETSPAEDPIAISRKRRSELYEPGVTPERAKTEPNVGLSSDATHVSLSYLDADERGSIKARLIGRIMAVVAVVTLIAGIALWYYMPAVTVEATLRQGEIGTELLYSVARPGASTPSDAAFAVEAEEVTGRIEFSISVPTTGKQVTPDGTASGSVTLRNASAEPVTIPAGTALTTATGVGFETSDEVEVPAGSPDGSTIGEMTVAVTASEAGSGGNLETGHLSGKIADQPVYFSNRDAEMTGGSDIEVAVVSEEDIVNLESQVEGDLRRVVAEDWTAQLPEGQAILTPSVEVGTPDFTINQAAGDVSETVTLSGTADATGLQYNDAEVKEQARTNYESALASQVPEGYELVPESVRLGEPQLVSESPNSVEFTMGATATVRAIFDDNAEESLVSDLAGVDEDQAESILANVPAFEGASTSSSPGWWPGGMPQTASRITIEIEDLDVNASNPETGTPVSTPSATDDPA